MKSNSCVSDVTISTSDTPTQCITITPPTVTLMCSGRGKKYNGALRQAGRSTTEEFTVAIHTPGQSDLTHDGTLPAKLRAAAQAASPVRACASR